MSIALNPKLQVDNSDLDLRYLENLSVLKQRNEEALAYIKKIYSSTKTDHWKFFVVNTLPIGIINIVLFKVLSF